MKTKENKSWVFLFGGQGSQKPGMGIDIFEAYPGKGYFHGPFCCREEMVFLLDPEFKNLNETLYAQLALTVFGLTVLDLLKEAGIEPGAALGLSAGEFPALAAASVYSPESVLSIIRKRARLMSDRLKARRDDGHEDGMLAVLGLEEEQVKELLSPFPGLVISNINAKTQITVSGAREELFLVEEAAFEAGARKAVLLDVEGAFHSPVFAPDVPALRDILLSHEAGKSKADLPLNILGRPADEEGADVGELYADLLSRQMVGPTRLDDSFGWLLDRGYRNFVEIAPTAVLTPLLRRRDRELNLHHIGDHESLLAFIRANQAEA